MSATPFTSTRGAAQAEHCELPGVVHVIAEMHPTIGLHVGQVSGGPDWWYVPAWQALQIESSAVVQDSVASQLATSLHGKHSV